MKTVEDDLVWAVVGRDTESYVVKAFPTQIAWYLYDI